MCRRCVEPWSSGDDGVKKRRYASEQETPRVQQLRHEYRRWLDRVDIHNLVFVDQVGVNRSMTGLYAPAMGGERAIDAVPRNAGENISLIGALSVDGLIAGMSLRGSVNTAAFLTYVREVLVPQLWQGAIVLRDNLRVHYAEEVRLAIESVGAKLVFLPPDSPDLSPIELCWSKLQQFLRSPKAGTEEALNQALSDLIKYISEEDAWGWFNHCGLFI